MQLTETNVQQVLITDSAARAVFCYFYADGPECAPATQALTTAISDNNAYISLVTANIREQVSQAIAMQLGLRNVPTLIVFKDGQPVDAVSGGDAIVSGLKDLMAKYMPSESELKMREALSCEAAGDLAGALSAASQAYEADKQNLAFKHILARLCIKQKNLSRAHELLDNPGREEAAGQEYQDLLSALTLAEQAQTSPELLLLLEDDA